MKKFNIIEMNNYYNNGGTWEEYLEDNELNQNDFFNLSREDRFSLWEEMPWDFLRSSMTYGISQILASVSVPIKFNYFKFFMDLSNYAKRRKAFTRLVRSWTQEKIEDELFRYLIVSCTTQIKSKPSPKPRMTLALRVGGGYDVLLEK